MPTITDPELCSALEHLSNAHEDFVAALKVLGSCAKKISSPIMVRAAHDAPASFRAWRPHRFIISFSRVQTNAGAVPPTFSFVHDPDGAPVCLAQNEESTVFGIPLPGGRFEMRRRRYRVIHGTLPALLRTSGVSFSFSKRNK